MPSFLIYILLVPMVFLVATIKMKILATGTNNNSAAKHSAGFTLIELLVVVIIIGILTSLATLSINLAKPSAVKSLKIKIQSHIVSMQNNINTAYPTGL
jgi:prepilin-type N-terminal cleavage/methylation domain-containing protein